jgi:phosphohistidine phosphatase
MRESTRKVFVMTASERYLFLIRHAEAEAEKGSLPDSERVLTAKGINQIHIQGDRLATLQPQQIIASHAVRARETALRLAPFWSIPLDAVKQDTLLYEAQGAQQLVQFLQTRNNRLRSLVLVGHNPLLNSLMEMLTACPSPGFPKAAIAGLRLNCKRWQDIQSGSAELCFFYLAIENQTKRNRVDLERRLISQIWKLFKDPSGLERPDNVRDLVFNQAEKLARKLEPLLPAFPLDLKGG